MVAGHTAERQLALFRIADELEKHADKAADLESENTGKPRATSLTTRWFLPLIRFASLPVQLGI